MSDPIIHAHHLQRRYRVPIRRPGLRGAFQDLLHPEYRAVQAVQDVSFALQPGESVAYLGPNGAGKSTTVKMLAGILKPSGGELCVLGYHPHRDRQQYVRHIGVVFGQRTTLWFDLAVIESLRLLQRVYAIPEPVFQERLALFDQVLDLGRLLATPARKLSLGQRVRADLAAALLHDPRVVFLDEPTIGLDVSVKARIREFLRRINREFGTTLLLTTHDLGDVEAISDRVLVIDAGQLIFDGTTRALREDLGRGDRITVVSSGGNLRALNAATQPFHLSWTDEGQGRYSTVYDGRRVRTPDLVSRALSAVPVDDLQLREASIEDVVRELYERGRHDG
ncbi:ATP-binding cassette domain-containing protein [Deinococcus sp. YIM 77859]|uniref:ABC transporter ATP-binding protein n=1 Tax=Deinococcus sp. YIM 77859 TaxID=1540221 RepID=UPI00054FB8CA|nr:ATP-binding cassette domain-containing protein [Deinococcus sp. YIM 77859]